MYLQDIFEHLATGEFQKTTFGDLGKEVPEILPEHYPLVIPAINIAILETHKRLPMRQESVIVELHPHITMYRMHRDHAYTNTASTKTKYLRDSKDYPFENSFLVVEHVHDMGGLELPVNDHNDQDSVFTPRHDIIKHPYPQENYIMEVTYRAGLPKIPTNFSGDPKTYELDMPDYALVPVLAYTLSRNEIGMIRGENVQSEMQALIKFETACQSIENSALIRRETYTCTDIRDEGWV